MERHMSELVYVENGQLLVLSARVCAKAPQRIVLYKVDRQEEAAPSMLKDDLFREDSSYYVAVPEGGKVTIRNMPAGAYQVTRLTE